MYSWLFGWFGRILLLSIVASVSCRAGEPQAAPPVQPTSSTIIVSPTPTAIATPTPASETVRLVAEPVIEGLEFASSFEIAPDGRIFIAERLQGNILIAQEGKVLPDPFLHLDVARLTEATLSLSLDPDFRARPFVYVFYTLLDKDGQPVNRVSRFRDQGNAAGTEEVILDGLPAAAFHNGGVLAFGPDGKLYVPIGDTTFSLRAQDLDSMAGKVHRLEPDGSIPVDNPFDSSYVYSYGHRNIFGMTWHPLTGKLFITENGPTRDDEINVIQPGKNYGWPFALGFDRDPLFEHEHPIATFTPNIAPTGAAFYTGDQLPIQYKNDLFFGDWNTGNLRRVILTGPDWTEVESMEVVLRAARGGILDLQDGPDGYLYFSTPDAIYRLLVED